MTFIAEGIYAILKHLNVLFLFWRIQNPFFAKKKEFLRYSSKNLFFPPPSLYLIFISQSLFFILNTLGRSHPRLYFLFDSENKFQLKYILPSLFWFFHSLSLPHLLTLEANCSYPEYYCFLNIHSCPQLFSAWILPARDVADINFPIAPNSIYILK